MDTFGPGGSVIAAMMAIATGMARHVLCFRTLWEATFQQLMKEGKMSPPGGARTSSWQMPFGATSAAHVLALNAQRHFQRYGTTRETLGWIALNQRANAALNPTAIYRDPMTMDDYLNARMITTPFGLYDCDVPCDGAVAVIVSAVDAAKDMPRKPVLFEAVGTQIIERTDWDQTTMTHEPQVLGQSAHLWTRTSLRPKDVDVAELYDGFSFNCLSWLEALGFCGIGEAKDFLDGGKAIARDGVIPLNTHGGQLSHGRTHGMGLIHEAVTQLRGDAGERQVRDARVAVVSSGGLTPSGAILHADGRVSTTPPRVVLVDGVPMSGLIEEAEDPKAVIVAFHGGSSTAAYFDCPGHPVVVAAADGGRQRLHHGGAGSARLREFCALPGRHGAARTTRRAGLRRRSTRSSARDPAAPVCFSSATPPVASWRCEWPPMSEPSEPT